MSEEFGALISFRNPIDMRPLLDVHLFFMLCFNQLAFQFIESALVCYVVRVYLQFSGYNL